MAGNCVSCTHALRDHKVQHPVYDNRAEFLCRCGCVVDGSGKRISFTKSVSDNSQCTRSAK